MAEISIPPDATYRIYSLSRLLWKIWDDEFIVYHPVSGDTHLLDHVSGEILKIIESMPATRPDLASHISIKYGMSLDEKLNEYIGELLVKLRELHLIEPVQ
jgi:PqqD family protein of HPr-rel-A system